MLTPIYFIIRHAISHHFSIWNISFFSPEKAKTKKKKAGKKKKGKNKKESKEQKEKRLQKEKEKQEKEQERERVKQEREVVGKGKKAGYIVWVLFASFTPATRCHHNMHFKIGDDNGH